STPPGIRSASCLRPWCAYDGGAGARTDRAGEDGNPRPRRPPPGRIPTTLHAAPVQRQADREANLRRELRRPRREGRGAVHVCRFLPSTPARPWGNEAVRVGLPGESRLGRCDFVPAPPPAP